MQEAPVETEPEYAAEAPADDVQTAEATAPRPFPYYMPLDSNTQTLARIPLPLFYPLVLAVAAAAGFVLNATGRMAPVSPQTKPAVGAVMAAAGAAAVLCAGYRGKQMRDRAAVIDLYNTLVDMEAPEQLTPEDVKAVGDRYGVSMHRDQLVGLQQVYGQYLEAIIPTGDQQLIGDEALKIVMFKNALGLSDEEAAPVHIEVGLRLSRITQEYKDRQAQFEQRKAFQRLIYISYIVFGDQKAGMLLPWGETFSLTDAQLFVARRDNARAIFAQYIQARGGGLPADREYLLELRQFQLSIKLFDESAEEVVVAAARTTLEQHLEAAAAVVRAAPKKRDVGLLVKEVGELLQYVRELASYAGEEGMVPGLGTPSIRGGAWDTEAKRREVRDIVKAYVEEVVARDGTYSTSLDASLQELAVVLCLSPRDAAEIRGDVCTVLYRRLLREEVTSRRIDAAASPAAVLGQLVQKAGWTPEAAADLHKSLYRQKLAQLVAKKKLTAEDGEELKRIRRILCISPEQAAAAVKATAGRVLDEVLADIFMIGAKPVGNLEAERVEGVIKDLQLDRTLAKEILADAAKARFKAYVQQAQKERDRKAQVQILKKMVQFNALVVTPMLEKVKGMDAAAKEIADMLAQAMEKAKAEEAKEKAAAAPGAEGAEAAASSSAEGADAASPEPEKKEKEDPVQAVQKMIAAARGDFGEEERKAQKEITLGDLVDKPTRAELYKNYLMYSMSGDIVELPVGGVIRKKQNLQGRQAEMGRLQMLGDLLGMNQMEVSGVHTDLAEQAYKAQAQEVLGGSGSMSAERKAYLDDMAKQLGLQQSAADRIIREVRTEVMGSAAALEDGQKWTVEKVMELHGQGIDVSKMLEEPVRRSLLRRALDKKLGDGKGTFDADFLLKQLPSILGIEAKRVRMLLRELVGSRKRMLLVQAVSQARQKRTSDALSSLNNLLSAYRAQPDEAPGGSALPAVQWGEREELKSLYGLFCAKVADEAKRAELATLFGLSSDEVAEVASGTDRTMAAMKQQQEEEESFF